MIRMFLLSSNNCDNHNIFMKIIVEQQNIKYLFIYLLFLLSSQPCWCAQEKKIVTSGQLTIINETVLEVQTSTTHAHTTTAINRIQYTQ